MGKYIKHIVWCGVFMSIALASATAVGEEKKSSAKPLPLAVLAFDSNFDQAKNSGSLIAEILAVKLSMENTLRVLDRKDIDKTLKEQKLSLSGLVTADQAVKIGKLLGAKLLVTGRVTSLNSGVFVICKVVNAETSEMKGFFMRAKNGVDLAELVDKASDKLIAKLPGWIKELVPPAQRPPDDAAVLKQLLKGKVVPKIGVWIPEQHYRKQVIVVIDPAVETEFQLLMSESKMSVIEVDKAMMSKAYSLPQESQQRPESTRPVNAQRQAVRQLVGKTTAGEKSVDLQKLLPGGRYLICGEAFSEEAEPLHGLVICSARAEVKIIDLKTGKIVLADRETASAPGLSSRVAGKTALQKCGRRLARRMLPKLIELFPSAGEKKDAKK